MHVYSNIISLGQPTRVLCFNFEFAHNCFKQLVQGCLASYHQKMECCKFIKNQLTLNSHPLSAMEKKFSVIKLMEYNETADSQVKLPKSGPLALVTLKVYK